MTILQYTFKKKIVVMYMFFYLETVLYIGYCVTVSQQI